MQIYNKIYRQPNIITVFTKNKMLFINWNNQRGILIYYLIL